MDKIVIKKYSNEAEYQKDANKMRLRGYRIQTAAKSERSGCLRWILVGPLALVWKKHEMTVTYELEDSET